MPKESTTRCPFLDDPCEECHVANLTSGAVERAILYCGGEYDKCEIYGRLAMRQRQESDPIGESGSMADPGGQPITKKEEKDIREKNRSGKVSDGPRPTSGETP